MRSSNVRKLCIEQGFIKETVLEKILRLTIESLINVIQK